MKINKNLIGELRGFLILWSTQSLSALGSSMTAFALIVWTYSRNGSALTTALLSVASYAPYVIMSIFAGAFGDRLNKKLTLLVSDAFAALCTLATLILLITGRLEIWQLYILNAANGLMNTIQQPAADVTITLLVPKQHYQKVSGLRSFSNSLVTILTPAAATALLSLFGINTVLFFDLATFAAAFISLLFFVKIPEPERRDKGETLLEASKAGISYLAKNRGILDMILFFAAINLIASIYNAALPAMLLSREGGGEGAYGIVNSAAGIAMLAGSALASLMPEPKNRVRVIFASMLLSMGTENFILAFGRSIPVWCAGAVLGWIAIPIVNANLDVIFRGTIPVEMQGRVYASRNTLQFFTIPVGYFAGGFLVDRVFEPFMAKYGASTLLTDLFGCGKGSGAALLFFVIAIAGVAVCLIFANNRSIRALGNGTRVRGFLERKPGKEL